jgi:hypothetical protein
VKTHLEHQDVVARLEVLLDGLASWMIVQDSDREGKERRAEAVEVFRGG